MPASSASAASAGTAKPQHCTAATGCATIALRGVRHPHVAKLQRQARIVSLAVKELIKLHARMDQEARTIAHYDYELHCTLSFEPH
jgi:hypothetical protein